MKLIVTSIEHLAFNHQVVTVESDRMTVHIHLKNGDDFLPQDQVGKEYLGFNKKSEPVKAVKKMFDWLKLKNYASK